MLRRALPIAVVLIAGCARSEDASDVAADANQSTRTVEQIRPESEDEEPALGQWREALQDDQRAIEFGPAGAAPLFSIGCDGRRALLLQRHGLEPTGDLPVMLVTVGSETRRLAVTRGDGPIPMLRATLNSSDPLAVSLTRAAVTMTVRVGDSPPLILPPGPLVTDYSARCARGELAAAATREGGDESPNANAATANTTDAGD